MEHSDSGDTSVGETPFWQARGLPARARAPHPGAPVPGLRAGACLRNPQGSAFRGRLVPLSTVSSRATRDGRVGEPPRCPGRAAPRRVAGPHLRTCPRVRDARLASTFGDRPCRGRGVFQTRSARRPEVAVGSGSHVGVLSAQSGHWKD